MTGLDQRSTAVTMISAVLLFVTFAFNAQADEADLNDNLVRGTMAQPIERVAPRYPVIERRKQRQGWVQLSYVVSKEGKVLHPVVENSSGSARFERAAIDTISDWLYEPATWDGEPIEQCRTNMLISFALEGDQPTNSTFAKRYNTVAGNIKDEEYDRAQAGIDILFNNDRLSMHETAYTRILAGRLAEKTGDDREALRHYHKAIVSSGLWVQEETYSRALWSIIALEVQVGSLSSAFRHHDKLMEIEGLSDEYQPLTDYVNEVRAELATRPVLETAADLQANSSCEDCAITWNHSLLRRHFGIDEIKGALDTVDIRCDWKRVVDAAREGVTWSIPEEWGNCHLIVTGTPGTTFSVLETNELEKAVQ